LQRILAPLGWLNQYLKQSTTVYMVLVASLIGLLGGYAAVGFRLLIQHLQQWIWSSPELPSEHYSLLEWLITLPWYWIVFIPAAGGLIVGLLVFYGAPEAKGHGVPEVMQAVAVAQGRIRARVVAIKALASSICIATGGSVGREGPIVQIGAAMGSSCGQMLGLGPRRMRTLVGCGAAAGIAATFNAPVAGALFAVEVILGDFGVPQFSPIVISSVVATVVSRHFLGDFPAFDIPAYSMHHPAELLAYVVLGLLAGLVAIGFTRSVHSAEGLGERWKLFPPLKTMLGGLAIGLLALKVPEIMGVGYEAMNVALEGKHEVLTVLMVLIGVKVLAVSITLGTGGSGGIFAPSLFLGSMLGGAVGVAVHYFFPSAAPAGAYALVGMGAVVASTTHAPITAIMILFELTTDYKIILPLMISSIIGTLVMTRLHGDSIYTIKLRGRGIQIRRGQDLNLLRSIKVEEVLRQDPLTVKPNERLSTMLQRLFRGAETSLYVVDDQEVYHGVVALNALRPILEDADSMSNLLVAADTANSDWPTVTADETLDKVLQSLDAGYRDVMPVLDGEKLIGVVHLEDVLERYRMELFKNQMVDGLAESMPVSDNRQDRHRVGSFLMAEVDVPPTLVGRSMAEMSVRQRYGVNVLLVRTEMEDGDLSGPHPPDPDYCASAGDRLVVFGPESAVDLMQDS
jgi:chloride channel protein, CIC family